MTPPAAPPTRPTGGAEEYGLIAPLVRKMAREYNLDLSKVKGTGAGGRITKQDVETYMATSPTTTISETVAAQPLGLLAGTKKINPKDGLTYIWIPPGSYMMGCSPMDNDCRKEEKPAHRVEISKGFWIG